MNVNWQVGIMLGISMGIHAFGKCEIASVAALFLFVSMAAFSQGTSVSTEEKKPTKSSVPILFDGLYLGVSTGYQNIFGGSFVNGVDVLAQDTRKVWEIPIGYRKQFIKGRYLLGLEYSFGFTDGNLMHTDDINQLEITYENDSQSGFGGIGGITIGRKRSLLIYGYLNETSRNLKFVLLIKAKLSGNGMSRAC